MKLKRLLLPIASVASTASIIAPIVTSCGGSYTLDGSKIYVPKIEPASYDRKRYGDEGMNYEEGRNLYLESIKENPDIYKEDVLCTLSATLYNKTHRRQNSYINGTNATGSGFKSKIKVKFNEIKANTENKTISISLSGSIKLEDNHGDTYEKYNIKSFSIEAYDLLFVTDLELTNSYDWYFLTYPSETSKATIKVNGSMFTGWSLFEYNYDEFTINGLEGYKSLIFSRQQFVDFMTELFGSIQSSYHMKNIIFKEEFINGI